MRSLHTFTDFNSHSASIPAPILWKKKENNPNRAQPCPSPTCESGRDACALHCTALHPTRSQAMDALKAEIRKRKAEARSGGGGAGGYGALSDVEGESSLQGAHSKQPGRGAAQAVEQERGGQEKRREEEEEVLLLLAEEKRRALKEARAERDRKRAKKLNVNGSAVDGWGGARDDGNASGSADATATAAASKDASLVDSQDATAAAAAAAHSLSELDSILETQRGLRAKGEPIQLFGESIKERRLRLRALELLEERGGGAGRSGQNDFMRAMAGAEAKDAEVALEAARRAELGMSSSATKSNSAKEGKNAQGDAQEGSEEAQKREKESVVEEKGREGVGMNSLLDLELVKKDIDKVYPIIYYTLKGLLRDWEEALAQRSLEVRQTTQGKLMAATQVQSAEYLKPLFKQLRQR
ncbi:hypothetical protein IE81DRAFT_326798, partial [Ceraceosorus guamensis]